MEANVLQALKSELEQTIKNNLKLDISTIITACLQRLNQMTLRPDGFKTTDYIELMIQPEIKEKKSGFQEKIKSLNSLLDKARLARKIRAGESALPEEGAATVQPCFQEKTKGLNSLFGKTSSGEEDSINRVRWSVLL